MSRSVRVVLALVGVFGLLLVGCAKSKTDVGSSPTPTPIPTTSIGDCVTKQGAQPPAAPKGVDYKAQLKEAGVLNVGSDNNFPPFEEIKAGASEPTGFDVDLYKEVAKRLGLTAKSTTTDFDALFTQSLPRGQFDIGVSAITIKEERKNGVDFSIPYFRADLSLAVNVEKTPSIKTVDDLSGLTLGVQEGTTGADCADALVKLGKAKEVRKYKDAPPAFDDLVAGRVAAVVNDRPASEGIIAARSALKVVQVLETKEQYGFAVAKTKPDLRVAIDKEMKAIMEDGTFAKIYKTWFNTDVPFTVPIQ
jgi:polar amino acid transport system substrate-binding protein